MQGKQVSKYQQDRMRFLKSAGMTNKAIAQQLGLSVTVVSHVLRRIAMGQDNLRKNAKPVKRIPYRQFTEYVNNVVDIRSWFDHNRNKNIPCAIEKIPKPGPGLHDRYAVWVIGEKAGVNGTMKNTQLLRGEIVEEAHGFRKAAGI